MGPTGTNRNQNEPIPVRGLKTPARYIRRKRPRRPRAPTLNVEPRVAEAFTAKPGVFISRVAGSALATQPATLGMGARGWAGGPCCERAFLSPEPVSVNCC